MCGQVPQFLDATGKLWLKGALVGKKDAQTLRLWLLQSVTWNGLGSPSPTVHWALTRRQLKNVEKEGIPR